MTLSITTLCIWVPLWWVSFCRVSHFIYCYAECHYVDVVLLNVLGPSLSLANLSSLACLPVRPEPTRVYLSSAPLYCRLLTWVINIRLAWKGPTTFSITTLSITTLSINNTQHNNLSLCHYAECCLLFIVMLNVIMLCVIMINVDMLSAVVPMERPARDKHYRLHGPFVSFE